MAQRAYLIVLDDGSGIGGASFGWFENFAKESLLKEWQSRNGFSAMDHVELTVSAEDADGDEYPEGSDRDDGDIMQDLSDTVEQLQEEIRKKKG